jgi:hypothetical protein
LLNVTLDDSYDITTILLNVTLDDSYDITTILLNVTLRYHNHNPKLKANQTIMLCT